MELAGVTPVPARLPRPVLAKETALDLIPALSAGGGVVADNAPQRLLREQHGADVIAGALEPCPVEPVVHPRRRSFRTGHPRRSRPGEADAGLAQRSSWYGSS